MPDWKSFRLTKLNTPEFRHIYLLLFWLVYMICFESLELWVNRDFDILHCRLDDFIPFNEYFVIPYLFWFVYMGGMCVYALFFDTDTFVYYMKLVMITASVACITYLVYPNALNLRPTVFERDNIFTQLTGMIYSSDTSTNVCPSMHVTGSVATMLAGLRARHMQNIFWKLFLIVSCVVICISTVFMKQHSVIDVFWGLVVSAFAWLFVKFADKRTLSGAVN